MHYEHTYTYLHTLSFTILVFLLRETQEIAQGIGAQQLILLLIS